MKIEEEIASDWELSKERTDRTEVKESDPGSPDSLHLRDGLSLPFLGKGRDNWGPGGFGPMEILITLLCKHMQVWEVRARALHRDAH